MTSPDDQHRQQTAEVVMYWVRRRGLTRKIFADRLGKSLSWVDKIRNGDRQLDRLSVLKQIAGVLDIPLSVLIDPEQAEQLQLCPDKREIEAIRHALRRYDAITNVFRPNGDVLPSRICRSWNSRCAMAGWPFKLLTTKPSACCCLT
jgi:transcriptional regulator with XRE-family HTH domain